MACFFFWHLFNACGKTELLKVLIYRLDICFSLNIVFTVYWDDIHLLTLNDVSLYMSNKCTLYGQRFIDMCLSHILYLPFKCPSADLVSCCAYYNRLSSVEHAHSTTRALMRSGLTKPGEQSAFQFIPMVFSKVRFLYSPIRFFHYRHLQCLYGARFVSCWNRFGSSVHTLIFRAT